MIKTILSIISFLVLVVSCATYPQMEPTQKSNLTVGTVKSRIVKGETRQSEILEIFGSPNLVTVDKDENEVWNYNKMSFTGNAANQPFFLGFGSKAVSTTTTSSFDLMLTFDKDDVVINYTIISASY